MKLKLNYNLDMLKGDLFGGVTAAIVGLPVALAFGIASGLGPLAGLYGAVAVGFFASVFGGTKSQISGPTAPMAVAMAVVVARAADGFADAFTIVIMAGVIQMALGLMRVGRFVSYTPYSVVSGFMSGIGVIVMLVHIMPFLGASLVSGGPINTIRELPDAIGGANFSAMTIAGVTLAVAIFWPGRLRKFLPPTLAALVVGTVLGILWLTNSPIIGEVPSGLPSITLPDFSVGVLVDALPAAVTIALLGSIDSLLTSLIADSITRTRHNANRELFGQGLGNMAAGFIGALPGAGATLGTVVNIRAGGRSQLSGVVRAGILLALVLGLGFLVERIPHAVLAGILIKVGWDIVDWRFITRIHRVQREHLIVMVITMGMTVFMDLITAVIIGLIAAGMASARQIERLEMDSVVSVPLLDATFFEKDLDDDDMDEQMMFSARTGLVSLRGSFTVASSSKLIDAISLDIQQHEVVILDFSDTVYIDDSAALVVEQLIDMAYEENTSVIVMGLDGNPAATLRALNVLKRVSRDRFVENLDQARLVAARLLAV